jgi:hypothetical protein
LKTDNIGHSQLFKRMLDQFDRLRKRNAFLEQYKKEKMFENGLEEFDDARYELSAVVISCSLLILAPVQRNCRGIVEGVQGL